MDNQEYKIPESELFTPEDGLEYIRAVQTDLAENNFISYSSSELKKVADNFRDAYSLLAESVKYAWAEDFTGSLEQIRALQRKEDPAADLDALLGSFDPNARTLVASNGEKSHRDYVVVKLKR